MTHARLGALALLFAVAASGPGAVRAQGEADRSALVVLVSGASFEELLAIADAASLSRAGGAALLVNPQDIVEFDGPALNDEVRAVLDPGDSDSIVALVQRHRGAMGPPDDLLVILLGADLRAASPTRDIGGVVLAHGAPDELFPEEGEQGALTSGSTRRAGVVTGGDIRATLVEFLGSALNDSGRVPAGEPIEIIEGPPPFELHERYLAQRRLYVPIGTAAVLAVAGAALAAIAFSVFRRRVPVAWCRAAGWASLSVPMLAIGLLAAGHLPELSYATAVPMVAIVTVFGTLAFSPLERRDLTLVPAGIGLAVLAFFAVEALLGWSGMLTTLLGGSQLDGGRFYGLPNVAIGLLVGSALWVAQRLPTLGGFSLLCGLGLFAGLPFIGADLGGAVTSFAAAGLWVAIRERERLGVWWGSAVVVGVTGVGTALILVAHAISPIQTHVTRFEQDVEGLGGVLDRFLDRLQVGFDLIERSPAALVPVLGLPVVLFVVLRPPAAIRATFERWPAWRDAVLVTILAGIVAYVANDSGPSAAGFAFGLGLGGMVGVSLLFPADKMVAP